MCVLLPPRLCPRSFYAGLGLSLPVVPPMMLVDSGALNEAEGRETHGRGRGGGPVFHVRGQWVQGQRARGCGGGSLPRWSQCDWAWFCCLHLLHAWVMLPATCFGSLRFS